MANEFTDTNVTGTAGIVGDIKMTERADHLTTPAAGLGILWTKNTTPSTLMFTDDAGTDTTLGSGGSGITALTGDVTASGSGSVAATIASGAVDIAMLSATGTPSGSTYLRGDNTWAAAAGSGDVSKVGTPVDGQIGVWTGNGTIEGDASLTFDTTDDTLVIAASGKLGFGAVDILSDSAGTTTLQNIDALDATTEATIEAAIDTLGNLTSIQGQTVTVSGTTTISGTNTGDVTLAGTPDYITISGQVITRGAVDLAADVTGTLPVANGGTGATTLGDAGVLIGNGTGAVQVTTAGTAGQVLTSNGAGVDPTFQAASGGVADGATLATGFTFPNTGLHILDTNASHDLIIAPGSDLTADHTLTITTGDADRTLTMTGAASIEGTNTGDVTLAGTPDYITISGQVITRGLVDLAADVTGDLPLANIAQIAQNTIAGRAIAAGTGDITALTILQVRTMLQTPSAVTSTSNSVAWNSDNAQTFTHTLTENTTIAASSGTLFNNQIVGFDITGAATPYTLAWNSQFDATGVTFATIPAVTTINGGISRYLWKYNLSTSKLELLAHVEQ